MAAVQAVSKMFIGPRELSSSNDSHGDASLTAEELAEIEREHIEHKAVAAD